jgi:hypothetical protein
MLPPETLKDKRVLSLLFGVQNSAGVECAVARFFTGDPAIVRLLAEAP